MRTKRKDISDDVLLEKFNKGLTLNEIARRLDCSVSTVVGRLERNGIAEGFSRSDGAQKHYDRLADKEWSFILEDVELRSLSLKELRIKYGMTVKRLRDLFDRQGFDYDGHLAKIKEKEDQGLKELLRHYRFDEGKTVAEIAQLIGKSSRTVTLYMSKFDLSQNPDRTDIKDEEVLRLHHEGFTVSEMTKKLSCSHDTLTKRLLKYNISVGQSEGILKHFHRTHNEIWDDIKYDLDYGCGITYISNKYKIRPDNVERLINRYDYVTADDINNGESLLNELRLCEVGSRYQIYKKGIISFYEDSGCFPSLNELSDLLGVSRNRCRSYIVTARLFRFVRMVRLSEYVIKFVQDLDVRGIEYEINNRMILKDDNSNHGSEIDVYIPDLKLGFEINPTFTHSVDTPLGVDSRLYHQRKSLLGEMNGIGLVHMYEDDFLDKERYYKILSYIESQFLDRKRIGARECIVKDITDKECSDFLAKYHLQGDVKSKSLRYGLYFGEKLLSVLVLGKPRFTEHDYEVVRYCVNFDSIVMGGFQKLFKYFLRTLDKGVSIMTYMDLNKKFTSNNVYEKSGFIFDRLTDPDYVWCDVETGEVLPRYQTTKAKLKKQGYDITKTEVEIMKERGYVRVFRAGSKRFVYNYVGK